jgi:hypothetical protein
MSSSSNYDLGDTPIIRGRDVVYDNVRCINVDLESINDDPYPPGGGFLPVPVANKVLRTNGLAAVSWGDVGVSNLTGGSANQIMHTKSDASGVEWTSNLTVPGNLVVDLASTFTGNGLFENDCSVENDLNVVNGDMVVANGNLTVVVGDSVLNNLTCSGLTTTDGILDVASDLKVAGSSGSSGNILKKTGASTQAWSALAASDVKGGSLNQVMVSNGTNAVFTTDLTLPGNLLMSSGTAVANFIETRQFGAFKLGGDFAGSLGAVCVSDGSSVPHWEYPQYYAEYYQNAGVDMNGGGSVLLMDAASVNVSNSNITYLAGVFTCPAGNYRITFQTRPVVASGGKSLINFRVNGVMSGSTCTLSSVTEAQQVILDRNYRFNSSTTVEVVSQTLVAGAVNTSGADSNGVATTLITIQRIGAFV